MKKIVCLLLLLSVCFANAQNVITDKGYFYSPNGFICVDGNIYTSDMKTMVKAHDNVSSSGQSITIKIPSGAEIIPSHLIYSPIGKKVASGNANSYCVVIPSSVKYISVDAFLVPNIYFESGENDVSSTVQNVRKQDSIELARYNIHGERLLKPQKGINIVQMSNHTSYKEYVK